MKCAVAPSGSALLIQTITLDVQWQTLVQLVFFLDINSPWCCENSARLLLYSLGYIKRTVLKLRVRCLVSDDVRRILRSWLSEKYDGECEAVVKAEFRCDALQISPLCPKHSDRDERNLGCLLSNVRLCYWQSASVPSAPFFQSLPLSLFSTQFITRSSMCNFPCQSILRPLRAGLFLGFRGCR